MATAPPNKTANKSSESAESKSLVLKTNFKPAFKLSIMLSYLFFSCVFLLILTKAKNPIKNKTQLIK